MNNDYVIDSLTFMINSLKDINKSKDMLETNNGILQQDISNLEIELKDNREAKVYYSKAVDILYQESIGALKTTLDTALRYTFYDRNLEADLVLKDERGNKTLDVLMNDLDKELYGLDPLEDDGAGIATVFSAVIKFYLLLCVDSKVLFLDEKYSNVSREYTERFFDFLKETCKSKGIIVDMISHDPRFNVYADKVLNVQRGNVLEMEND